MALNKEQQQKILLVLVVVVTFCYVYFKYLLGPTRVNIAQTETELQSVLQRVDTLKMTASRLPQLRKQTEELDLQVAKVEKRLPRTRNLEDIIRIVTELAKKKRGEFFVVLAGGGVFPNVLHGSSFHLEHHGNHALHRKIFVGDRPAGAYF